ncbi:MAG: SPOR domain-containing protein [Deltaproteobacteria bacterium]
MDKNKIIQSATKFVQKGQFDKAIKEYQRILDEDPKDIRILLKVGELHQKRGDNVQAAQYLLKVAEAYSNDGFFLKAAAVYKQVLKLNPSLVDVNLKLAELYQQLGLMNDALQQFQLVASSYEHQGDMQAALGILRKLIELDPENVANRIRLAESFAREGMNAEAIAEFKKVAAALKENNRADEYVKVAERLSFLDPQNLELSRDLANVYLAKGDTKRALAKLQNCFKADPKDIDTLVLLAQAFKELGQLAKTVSVYKELAKIYSDSDRADDERATWRKILSIAPDDPEARQWGDDQPSVPKPASAPAVAPVQSRPVRASAAAPQSSVPAPEAHGPEAIAKLLTETDVYLKYGLHAKATEHLKKILSVAPDNLIAHEKAKDLFLTMGDKRRAADELAIAARLAHASGAVDVAHHHLRELGEIAPDHPELGGLSEQLGAPVEVAEIADDAILVDAAEEALLVAADGEDIVSASDEDLLVAEPEDEGFAGSELLHAASGDAALIDGDEALSPESTMDAPLLSDVDDELMSEPVADDLVQETVEGDLMDGGILAVEPDSPSEIPIDEDDAAEATVVGLALPSEPAPAPRPPERRSPLQSVSASPLSIPTQRREPPVAARAPAPSPANVSPPSRAVAPPVAVAAPSVAPVEEEEPEELAEAEFFLTQGLLDEAREVLDGLRVRGLQGGALERLEELEARLLGEEASQAAPEPSVVEDGQFDLAAELEKEVAEARAAQPAEEDFQYSVEDVLRDFKKGIEKVVRPEDVETHYDLGIAYKEMGLVDEAISEFELAAKGAASKAREGDCLAMLGLCLGVKGDLSRAVSVFEQALAIQGLRPETQLNLHFEIGTAKEGLGDVAGALDAFQKVANLDPKYREVAQLVARLKAIPQKTRKVGYV